MTIGLIIEIVMFESRFDELSSRKFFLYKKYPKNSKISITAAWNAVISAEFIDFSFYMPKFCPLLI